MVGFFAIRLAKCLMLKPSSGNDVGKKNSILMACYSAYKVTESYWRPFYNIKMHGHFDWVTLLIGIYLMAIAGNTYKICA